MTTGEDEYAEEINAWFERMVSQIEVEPGFGPGTLLDPTRWERFVDTNLEGASDNQVKTLTNEMRDVVMKFLRR